MIKEEEEYTTSEEYVLTALDYIQKRNPAEAKKYLLKAHELFPDNFWPLSYLLSIELEQKNFKEAIKIYYKIIEMRPHETHYQLMLRNLLRVEKKHKEGIEISKKH